MSQQSQAVFLYFHIERLSNTHPNLNMMSVKIKFKTRAHTQVVSRRNVTNIHYSKIISKYLKGHRNEIFPLVVKFMLKMLNIISLKYFQ